MKILATSPLYSDVQIEIVKAFLYFLCKIAKEHEVVFALCQNKKMKEYKKNELEEKLISAGVKMVYISDVLQKDSNTEKEWYMDNAVIERQMQIKVNFDLVLIYAYCVSESKQIKEAFKRFYLGKNFKITFNSLLGKYKQIYPFYYLARKYNIPTIQFIVDWLEPDLNLVYKHSPLYKCGVYSHKERNVRFLPIYDMYIFRKGFREFEKDVDFIFGYTITFASRKYLHNLIKKGIKENENIVIYARDRYWADFGKKGRNDAIPQNEYFAEVERAKFSLIVPANNKQEFSIQRFYECLSRNCIPLIERQCVLKNAFSGMLDVIEFYEDNNLIIDLERETINSAIARLNYNNLLQELRKLESVQKLFDLERYKAFVKKFSNFVKKYVHPLE